MTPEQFVFWLSGILSICDPDDPSFNHGEVIKRIIAGLKTVKNNQIQTMLVFGSSEE